MNSMDRTECGTDFKFENPLENIIYLISILNKKFERIQNSEFRKLDLTAPQFSILTELWKEDSKPFKELAKVCCCSRSTITGIIDTMEKNELVKREANPDDRRSILVKLTEKGNKFKQITPSLKIVIGDCCEGIKKDELQQLSQLLMRLNQVVIES